MVLTQHETQPWQCKEARLPDYFWRDKGNQLKFIVWLAKRMKINKMEDWYKVKISHFLENGINFIYICILIILKEEEDFLNIMVCLQVNA